MVSGWTRQRGRRGGDCCGLLWRGTRAHGMACGGPSGARPQAAWPADSISTAIGFQRPVLCQHAGDPRECVSVSPSYGLCHSEARYWNNRTTPRPWVPGLATAINCQRTPTQRLVLVLWCNPHVVDPCELNIRPCLLLCVRPHPPLPAMPLQRLHRTRNSEGDGAQPWRCAACERYAEPQLVSWPPPPWIIPTM